MSQVGMVVTYTKRSLRQPLSEQPTQGKCQELLERYYIPHHQKLTEAVEESLLANEHCLIIDGHSFPALPLPSTGPSNFLNQIRTLSELKF